MGSEHHFCLRWNNFHSNIASSIESLRDQQDFVDVTLACEGRSLKAHKIVLSACSPYFKTLLKQNPCQHPIIILRDVSFPDLSALLSFVYQGEVYVAQERLSAFLRTAEMLHIKGLTDHSHHHTTTSLRQGAMPATSPTVVTQSNHEQSMLGNEVRCFSGIEPASSPCCGNPPSPPPASNSPPSKKRRPPPFSVTVLPEHPPSSISPSLEENSLGSLEERVSSSLQTALTKTHLQQMALPSIIVKQEGGEDEREGIKTERDCDDDDGSLTPLPLHIEQAVNLVTEGSILRQRIQGFHGPSEVIPLPQGKGPPPPTPPHEDSLLDTSYLSSEGGEEDPGTEGEVESYTSQSMVIRSPMVGHASHDASGFYGGAGTSTSLGSHESSQDHVLNLSTGCSPKDTKKWPSRQPVNCQYCGVRISMAFNLRNHVKRCKMRPFTESSIRQSIRGPPLSSMPQTHQQSSQPEEALEDPALNAGGSFVSTLSQTVSQQVLTVDSHQLIPLRSEASPAVTDECALAESTICTKSPSPTPPSNAQYQRQPSEQPQQRQQ